MPPETENGSHFPDGKPQPPLSGDHRPMDNPSPAVALFTPNETEINKAYIMTEMGQIAEVVKNHTDTIIISPPATGKSTVMVEELARRLGLRIVETEPRKSLTRSVRNRIQTLMQDAQDRLVGIRHKKANTIKESTLVAVMVEGSLSNVLLSDDDPYLLNLISGHPIELVIVDEVDTATDKMLLNLALMKRINAGRAKVSQETGKPIPPLKMILTTGTADSAKYAAYLENAPIHQVDKPQGVRPKPTYLSRDIDLSEMPAVAARVIAEEIVAKNVSGDILVVAPGRSYIDATQENIKLALGDKFKDVEILSYTSSTPKEEMDKITRERKDRPPDAKRRIILANSGIADRGVTLDIENLIDFGYEKLPAIDAETGIINHNPVPASQAVLTQRDYRVARIEGVPGRIWRLMSQNTAENDPNRPKFTPSEMTKIDLAPILYRLKLAGIDIKDLHFMENPTPQQIRNATRKLQMLGVLDDAAILIDDTKDPTGKIIETSLARKMKEIEADPEIARMMVEAQKLDVVDGASQIAALFQNYRDLFFGKRADVQQMIASYRSPAGEKSDFIVLLKFWDDYIANKADPEWLKKHFVNENKMLDVEDAITDLGGKLEKIDIRPELEERIHAAIRVGFADKLLYHLPGENQYYWGLHPSVKKIIISDRSAVHTKVSHGERIFNTPKYIISAQIGKGEKGTVYADFVLELDEMKDKDFIDKTELKMRALHKLDESIKPGEIPPKPAEAVTPEKEATIPPIAEEHIDQAITEEIKTPKPKESIIRHVYDRIRQLFSHLNPINILRRIRDILSGKKPVSEPTSP